MDVKGYRKLTGIVLACLIVIFSCTPQMRYFYSLPTYQKITVGDYLDLSFEKAQISKTIQNTLKLNIDGEKQNILRVDKSKINALVAAKPGVANLQLKLFGLIPLKTMQVEVVPSVKLVPGGHSVGVMLHSEGVLVVGQSIVEDAEGNKSNPAKEAGIEVGDIILKINDETVVNDEQVARLVNDYGKTKKPLKVLIKHNKRIEVKYVKPVLCKETSRYRIGLYIRDTAAGVGTITFYDPKTGRYGALGHIITDVDTKKPIDIANGKVVRAGIQGIQPGRCGQPGEKIGMFIEDKDFEGNIKKNCRFGIFGTLKKPLQNPIYPELPVAYSDQINTGPAEILTVLDGEKINKYKIEIEKILPEQRSSGKGMVIHITDPRLLRRTGGIIQGMSGSPIIQNGRLIGAVTHVFINDPAKGYGCLIEWMLDECNSFNPKIGWRAKSSPSLCFFSTCLL
ncbi:stage IV sporulation protein B [Thermincola ferriacetica]|uniref:Stage IV sporulation protein B n=1 Tax=Thermincola ferriacetica TaxID=281456 RepID=A0A0L6W6K7_9FIRM|nr:SpoIVB peptidase [Thermincola ferriacetica]KNZ70744.1 stage IV sporulation protein B [Thermincola ferriacetica]